MEETISVNGIKYLSSQDAAFRFGYTSDYVTRLARQRKIRATRAGRQWFVDPKSLEVLVHSVEKKKEIRSKRLRRERKFERLQHEGVSTLRSAGSYPSTALRHGARTVREVLRESMPVTQLYLPQMSALVQAGSVTLAGLVFGMLVYGTTPSDIDRGVARIAAERTHVMAMLEDTARQVYEVTTTLGTYADASSMEAVVSQAYLWYGWLEKTFGEHYAFNTEGVVITQKDAPTAAESLDDMRTSFSDDVEVEFDPDSPDTGVVRPVFKDRTGDEYRFLLVPVRSP